MTKPEVLAPAGSWDALVAAVRAGADAVYLGADVFNARRAASNFTVEELHRAVAFCHARGVAVHLTLNTLISDAELPQALALAQAACDSGVDALIIQDRGLARLIHEKAPSMPLHASTQLSCHTPAGVQALKEAGFCRVVLAREMTASEITACAGLGCELEVFVHGALCMSVSGQCALSALLGGRSGNRGACAQPCRLPFAAGHAPAAGEAALSLKDNCLRTHMETLRQTGVASLKIEGRMKRPEYVAAATAVWRQTVDGVAVDPTLLTDLQAVFSRSGFTDGYFTDTRDASMFGTRRKDDVTAASSSVFSRLRRLYDKERQCIPVSLSLTVARGTPLTLCAADRDGHTVTVQGELPEPARTLPLDPQRIEQQLGKTGGTPFFCEAAVCTAEDGLSLSLSAVNALRRDALAQLLALREQPTPCPFMMEKQPAPAALPEGTLSGLVARVASLSQIQGQADWWAVPLGTVPAVPHWGVDLPRGLFGRQDEVLSALRRAKENGATFALCATADAFALAATAELPAVLTPFYNVFNHASLACAAADGAAAVIPSLELTFAQWKELAKTGGCLGLFAYGRQPLMLFRNCPVSAAIGCAACGGHGSLTDRKGVEFPVRCTGGCSELLNSVPLYFADKRDTLPPACFWYLHFTDESPARVADVLREYREGGTPPSGFTRGLYQRGVL